MVLKANSRETVKKPSLGERRNTLRELRKAYELSLDELAKMSGLSKSMISKFELGHRDLSTEAWGRLDKALITLTAKRVTKAIGPGDRDYLAYKKVLRDEPQVHQRIGRIVDVCKKDLKQRDMLVDLLRKLSSKHKNQFVERWYKAERDALLAFRKIGKLDARFNLELATQILARFTIKPTDQIEAEVRRARKVMAGE